MSEKWVKHFLDMANKPFKSRKFRTVKDHTPLPVSIMSPTQQAVQRAELSLESDKKRRKKSIKGVSKEYGLSVLD